MAAVELAENDPGGAAARALAASEHAERAGAALVAARARSLAGRAFAAARDTERAVTELERALETFVACGARRDAAAAERELCCAGWAAACRPEPADRCPAARASAR